MHEPCSECGANRWRTKHKGEVYECRKCGATRMYDFIERTHTTTPKVKVPLRNKLMKLGRKK